jgi:hypothetical protein
MTFSRCLTRTGPTRPAGTSVRLPPMAIDPRPDWLIATCELLDRAPDPVGFVYLLHFDRPIGDLDNPRGYAGHYTSGRWTCAAGWVITPPARDPRTAAPGWSRSSARPASASSWSASGKAPGAWSGR